MLLVDNSFIPSLFLFGTHTWHKLLGTRARISGLCWWPVLHCWYLSSMSSLSQQCIFSIHITWKDGIVSWKLSERKCKAIPITKTGEVISRCNKNYIHLHLLLGALHLLLRIDACRPYWISNYYLTTVLHQHLGMRFLHTCQPGDSSLLDIMIFTIISAFVTSN